MRLMLSAVLLAVSLVSPLPAAASPIEDALRAEAERGNPNAQHALGLAYATGRGVVRDYYEAMKWFQLAAAQGFAPSLYMVGVAYAGGTGAPQDYREAAKWWRLAASRMHREAQRDLGVLYYAGKGVPRDYVQAYLWLALATTAGLGDAHEARDELAKLMTQAQMTEAQRLLRNWKPAK